MVTIGELLEAGVHFGHRVTKWNPKMAPFIFGSRNGIHIIDLVQTLKYLNQIYNELKSRRAPGAEPSSILFVGTKKQASPLIEKAAQTVNSSASSGNADFGMTSGFLLGESQRETGDSPKEISRNLVPPTEAHYVNHRWLGGLLTNWSTMKVCIDRLNKLEEQEKLGSIEKLQKKERAVIKKQYQKLNKFFGGIKSMKDRPNLVIIVGQDYEINAVRECKKLQESGVQLRTITILDTNCDPELADLLVPANDDSSQSIELILNEFTQALSNASVPLAKSGPRLTQDS